MQWKFTTPDQLASPSALLIEVLPINILLFLNHWGIDTCSKVINPAFKPIEFVDQLVLEKF